MKKEFIINLLNEHIQNHKTTNGFTSKKNLIYLYFFMKIKTELVLEI